MNAQHTPTPWTYSAEILCGYSRISDGYVGSDGKPVLILDPSEGEYGVACSKDNAAFIVRACNSHDALVAALQNFLKCEEHREGLTTAWDIAREALAAAGEA